LFSHYNEIITSNASPTIVHKVSMAHTWFPFMYCGRCFGNTTFYLEKPSRSLHKHERELYDGSAVHPAISRDAFTLSTHAPDAANASAATHADATYQCGRQDRQQRIGQWQWGWWELGAWRWRRRGPDKCSSRWRRRWHSYAIRRRWRRWRRRNPNANLDTNLDANTNTNINANCHPRKVSNGRVTGGKCISGSNTSGPSTGSNNATARPLVIRNESSRGCICPEPGNVNESIGVNHQNYPRYQVPGKYERCID
jgi:hypothetical protein